MRRAREELEKSINAGLLATGQTLRARGPAPMKPSALRIERLLAKVEAECLPPPRRWLRVIIIDDGDDEAEAKEKALAEHIAAHPEDAGLTVRDFNWIVRVIVRPAA
jgi:hypothetical protein